MLRRLFVPKSTRGSRTSANVVRGMLGGGRSVSVFGGTPRHSHHQQHRMVTTMMMMQPLARTRNYNSHLQVPPLPLLFTTPHSICRSFTVGGVHDDDARTRHIPIPADRSGLLSVFDSRVADEGHGERLLRRVSENAPLFSSKDFEVIMNGVNHLSDGWKLALVVRCSRWSVARAFWWWWFHVSGGVR